jgi:hypothetical protein
VTHLTLNGALVDLSVMQKYTDSFQLSNNQLIQVETIQVQEPLLQIPREHTVLMGNRKWIKEKNFIEISNELEARLIAQEQLGHTAILAAIDGEKSI